MNGQSYFSNCKISEPVLQDPSLQIITFNGLAWSNVLGMIHQVDGNLHSEPTSWITD